MLKRLAKALSYMQAVISDCSRAGPDQVCPVNEIQAFTSPFVVFGTPLLMLVAVWWLVSRFRRQMTARKHGRAALLILAGYAALLAAPWLTYPLILLTATGWGGLLIWASLAQFIPWVIYTPAWLIALLVAAADRKRVA
jgi:hypothetical protein